MEPGKPSQTAILAALFRASHLHIFDGPKIHEDTFALALSGLGGPDELRAFSDRFVKMNLPLRRISAYFAFRHRLSEERLLTALARGVDQVVLLGAGLDSFALRNASVPGQTLFLEIDHPDTQRWKRERIASLGLDTPCVRYLPVNLITQDLGAELAAAGVDRRRPVFIAWLGVTSYIAEEAIDRTLSLTANHAPGSEIIFDVAIPIDAQPPDEQEITRMSAGAAAARGEPWVTYLDPSKLESRLTALGLRRIQGTDAAPYYAGQPEEVRPLCAWQMIAAGV